MKNVNRISIGDRGFGRYLACGEFEPEQPFQYVCKRHETYVGTIGCGRLFFSLTCMLPVRAIFDRPFFPANEKSHS